MRCCIRLVSALLAIAITACQSDSDTPSQAAVRVVLEYDTAYQFPARYPYSLRLTNVSSRALTLVGCGASPTYLIEALIGDKWIRQNQFLCRGPTFDLSVGSPFLLVPGDSVLAQVFFSEPSTYRISLPLGYDLDQRKTTRIVSPTVVLR